MTKFQISQHYFTMSNPVSVVFFGFYSRLTSLLEIVPFYSVSYFNFCNKFQMTGEFLLLLWKSVAYLEPSQTSVMELLVNGFYPLPISAERLHRRCSTGFQMRLWKYLHCSYTQFPADLVTFTEEILIGKLHFLCSAMEIYQKTLVLVLFIEDNQEGLRSVCTCLVLYVHGI